MSYEFTYFRLFAISVDRTGGMPLTAKQRAALVSRNSPRKQALCSEMKKYPVLTLCTTNYTELRPDNRPITTLDLNTESKCFSFSCSHRAY